MQVKAVKGLTKSEAQRLGDDFRLGGKAASETTFSLFLSHTLFLKLLKCGLDIHTSTVKNMLD